jgi:hypothetical protein
VVTVFHSFQGTLLLLRQTGIHCADACRFLRSWHHQCVNCRGRRVAYHHEMWRSLEGSGSPSWGSYSVIHHSGLLQHSSARVCLRFSAALPGEAPYRTNRCPCISTAALLLINVYWFAVTACFNATESSFVPNESNATASLAISMLLSWTLDRKLCTCFCKNCSLNCSYSIILKVFMRLEGLA